MNHILRNFVLLLSIFICTHVANAQISMSNGTSSTCVDSFFDSGGASGSYADNENLTYTICAGSNTGGNTHVSLTFDPLAVGAGDLLCFYDGNNTGAPLIICSDALPGEAFVIQASAINPSGCVTITFTSDGAGTDAGWSAGINCVQKCQTILSVVDNTTPAISPPDTGYIDICPGDLVVFNGSAEYPQNNFIYAQSDNTSSFEWNFGDGSTGFGPNVQHAYPNPGGYIVQLTVTDVNGCVNTNLISQRIRVSGPPEFNLSEDLSPIICVNDTISIFTGVNDTLADITISPGSGGFQAGGTVADSVCVPDGTGETYYSTLELSDFSPGQTLNSIDDLLGICVDMEHSYLGDLEIIITCPSGLFVTLHNFSNFNGGAYNLGTPVSNSNACSSPNNVGIGDTYCWTPDATNGTWLQSENLVTGGQLPPGDYSSFQDLGDLVGCTLNGQWTISIEDSWGIDDGVIFSWNLALNEDIFPNLETFDLSIVNAEWVDDPSILINTADSMVASPQFPGSINYVFESTDNFGCVYDTTVNVTILPQTDPDCYNCTGNLTPMQDVTICDDGENAPLSTSLENVELTSTTFQDTPNAPFSNTAYPPGNPLMSTINVAGLPYNFIDASSVQSVCINASHFNDLEILATLIAPNGTSVVLTNGQGIAPIQSNFIETCFTPVATDALPSGTAPFTGSWMPVGDFGTLAGSQANGTWTLAIADQFPSFESNTLHSWNITFNLANDLAYSWSPGTGLSCDDCPDPIAQPTVTTDYEVNATDAYGCVFTESVTITVIDCNIPCNLSASLAGSTDASCSGISDGTAEITATGQAGNVFYELNGGVITQLNDGNFTDLPAGSYQVILTDDNSCTVSVDFTIDEPNPIALLLTPTNISCSDTNDGSIISSVSGGDGNYSYLWNNGLTTNSLGNLSAGTYTLTVTDGQNCSVTGMATVSELSPILILLDSTAISCFGETDGSATASVSGGGGTFDYSWSDGQITNPANNLAPGTYILTVTDANGCSASKSIEVTGPAAPLQITALSQTQTSCANEDQGEASISATGGTGAYSYLWTPGGFSNAVESSLPPGTYTVVVTDENSCSVSQSIDIIEFPLLESSITGTNISCNTGNDGTATANGIGGSNTYNYLWSDGQTTAMAINLVADTYTVLITDSNNCTTTNSVTITEPIAINQFDVVIDAPCFGGIGSAGTFQTGGAYPFQYNWSNGASAISTDSPYGTWNLDGNGCIQYTSKTLTGNFIDTICYTATDGPNLIEAYVITSVISPGNCMGDNNDTDGDGICDNADPNINDPCIPNSFDLNNNGVCDFLEPDIISFSYLEIPVQTVGFACIDLPAAFDAANTSFSYCNTSDGNLINVTAGTYTVTITDDNGCSLVRELTVNEPSMIDLALSGMDVSCLGGNDGEATVLATGGTPPYSYLWSGSAAQTTDNITGLIMGTYTVTVTDDNLCSAEESIVITEPSTGVQIVSALQTEISCFGENLGGAMVAASGGTGAYTYVWSSGGISDTETNLSPGTLTVTVSDANNCSISQTIEIVEHTPIIPDITGTNLSCNSIGNGTATAGASGGSGIYTYLWSDSNMQTSATATGLAAGPYIVTVTDSNSCSASITITLTEPAAITQTHVVSDVLCFGETNGSIVSYQTGGTPPYEYVWSTGFVSPSADSTLIAGLATGTYTVTITDGNSCSTTREFDVAQPSLLDLTFTSTDVNCLAGSDGVATANATGGIPPYTYLWGDARTTVTVSDLSAGTHTVTVTDANLCTIEGSIIITEPATAVQITSLSQTSIGCSGSNLGEAQVIAEGGTGLHTYNWSSGATTSSVSNLSPITYTVTVTDANGCSTTGTMDIVEYAPLSATVDPTGVSCFGGNNGTASISLISGGAGTGDLFEYTYAWSGTSQTGANVTGLSAGIHTVTITDIEGCTAMESIEIPSPSELTSSTTASHVGCSDAPNGAAVVTASGGTPPYTYEWDSGAGGATVDSISGLAPGGYNVTVTDENNCTTISYVSIYQIQPIEIGFDVVDNLCYGTVNGSVDAIVEGGTAPFTYAWSTGFTGTDSYIGSLATGIYSLTVTDAYGCEKIAEVAVSDPGELTFDVDVIDVTCNGDSDGSMLVTGSGGAAPYTYNFNYSGFTPTNYIGGVDPGYYNVAVRDNNGCIQQSDSVLVDEPLPLEAIIYPSEGVFELVLGDSLQLAGDYANGVGGISFEWSALYDESGLSCTGCQFPVLNTYENDRYTLTVTDENGCTDTEDIEIIIPRDRAIYVPGAFTPNGDNTNDVLMVHGKTGTFVQFFRVYDRWGELVFESKSYDINSTEAGHTWNGEFKGKPMNPGVFVWSLRVSYIDGRHASFEGNTNLLR